MKHFNKSARLLSAMVILLLVMLSIAGVPTSATAEFGVQEGGTGIIAGMVTDALKGAPIAGGVSVSVYDLTQTQVGSAQVTDGYYEVNGLYPGSYKVWIQDDLGSSGIYVSEWHDDVQGWSNFSAALPVSLTAPGENVTVNEDLWPGQAALGGRVTDDNGTAIANAYLTTYGPSEAETFADGEGYYSFPALYCGNYDISAFPPHGVNALPASTSAVLVLSGTAVDFTLLQGGIVSGQVTDEVGTGVPGALVCTPDGYAYTGPEGYYSIVGLPGGECSVTAAPPWEVNLLSDTTAAVVVEGSTITLDFVLLPGGIISGRVTAPDDSGVPDAWVDAIGPDNRGDYTDADGYYSIVGLVGGSYALTATPPYGSHLLADSGNATVVENATASVDFALLWEGVIAGRVTSICSGAGVPGVDLVFTGPNFHYATATTDDLGFYYVPQCVSGNWTVSATPMPETYLLADSASVEVVNGEATTLDFVLQSNDMTPPPAPILVYPADGTLTSDNTPWLDWSDVTDNSGVRYQVQVDNDADFGSPVVDDGGLGTSSHTMSIDLAVGAYCWRVRALDGPGNASDWTEPWTFTVDSTIPVVPTLLTPGNGTVTADSTPWLDWSTVTGASAVHYQLQVDDSGDFSSVVEAQTWVTSSWWTVSTALPDGVYYWRVRAVDAVGAASAWASAWTFTVDATAPAVPTLLTPTNGTATADNTPWLDWSTVTDATAVHYQLQVDDSADCLSPVVSKTWLNGSSWSVDTVLPDGVYYWRVRVVDAAGNTSAWTSAWTFTVDTAAPAVPMLVTLANEKVTTDSTPWLDWSTVTDATAVTYQLQVDDSADCLSPVVSETTLSDSSWTADAALPDGMYYWRVRAVDAAGNASAWAGAWTFRVDTTAPAVPALLTPTNGTATADNTPWLDWSIVTDATAVHYQLQVDDSADCLSPVVSKTWLNGSSWSVDTVLPDGVYYWRVRVVDAAGNTGAWTSAWTFTVDTAAPAVPTLVTLANEKVTMDSTPWLDWSTVTDATAVTYQLQVDDSADCLSPVVSETTLSSSSWTADAALPDGMYYWRVRAVDAAGNANAWASAWTFRVDTTAPAVPTLLTPANGKVTTDSTPWLDWSTVTDATAVHYQLQVDDSADCLSPVVSKTWLNGSSWTVDAALPDGVYYWRVRAVDAAGNASAWASAWTFRVDTTAPAVPTPLTPANGKVTTDSTPWLDWSTVTDATAVHYQLQVDDSADCLSPVVSKTWLNGSSWTVDAALPDGVYYWRVRAVDAAGNASAWASAWTFRVDTTAPAVPVLVTPANGQVTTDSTPWLDWSTVTDATAVHYQVQVDNSADFSSPAESKTWVNSSWWTVSSVLSPGTYYWRVRAVDAAGNTSAWTSAWTFTVQ